MGNTSHAFHVSKCQLATSKIIDIELDLLDVLKTSKVPSSLGSSAKLSVECLLVVAVGDHSTVFEESWKVIQVHPLLHT